MTDREVVVRRARAPRWVWLVGVVVVVVAAVTLGAWMHQRSEHERQVDEFYCSVAGTSVFDKAPYSGRLCGDVVRNG